MKTDANGALPPGRTRVDASACLDEHGLMFALAYVIILPFLVAAAEAITASIARFERGRRGQEYGDRPRFFDDTASSERWSEEIGGTRDARRQD